MKSSYLIPIAILVVFAVLIAAAFLFLRSASSPFAPALEESGQTVEQPASETPSVPPGPILLATPYDSGTKGEPLQFIWVIDDSQGAQSSHTALHWGTASYAGEYGSDVAPENAGYSNLTEEYSSGVFPLPGNFTATLMFPDAGTYYLRAHAVIDGKNFWTDEYTLVIE